MNTRLCKKLVIESPLFGFSHCRIVVAEVTNPAGLADWVPSG